MAVEVGASSQYLDVAKTNPPFWVGAVLVVLAFVRSASGTNIEFSSPRPLIAVGGFVLLGLGAWPIVRDAHRRVKDRFGDPACYDATFWHDVFDALPPTFIKACDVDDSERLGRDSKHIAENDALKAFEGSQEAGDMKNEDWKVILDDHYAGDEKAFEAGRSRQL